ncbi:MAG TPA: S1/P1 nuclease [Pyrinomonadaceae bacterium]|nr:S1/P1 nuclease [Pyrinomonadaceae bacterium]
MKHLITALFVTLITISQAAAWDDVGHKLTAYIAWQRMSPEARERVIAILRSAPEDSQLATFYQVYGVEPVERRKLEFFMTTATWADIVRERAFENRYKKYHHGNWHYSDIFWKQVNGEAEIIERNGESGLAVEILAKKVNEIKDSSVSDKEKAIAIAWIMHIIGDLHQPLHTSARITDLEPNGDQGGNLFLLSPANTPREQQLNLHWYWDSIISRAKPFNDSQCEFGYISRIANEITRRYPYRSFGEKLKLSDFEQLKRETFALNTKVVFTADLARNQLPGKNYQKRAFTTAERQIAMAGYRMGDLLEEVFGKQR